MIKTAFKNTISFLIPNILSLIILTGIFNGLKYIPFIFLIFKYGDTFIIIQIIAIPLLLITNFLVSNLIYSIADNLISFKYINLGAILSLFYFLIFYLIDSNTISGMIVQPIPLNNAYQLHFEFFLLMISPFILVFIYSLVRSKHKNLKKMKVLKT